MRTARDVAGLLAVALTVATEAGAATLRAKDLPRMEPVRAVRGCDGLGSGFRQVEGTDTCIRVTGSIRFETSIVTGGHSTETPRR